MVDWAVRPPKYVMRMKNLLLIFAFILSSTYVSVPYLQAAESSYSSINSLPEDARPITVYLVKQVGGYAWSNSPKSAYYSASENRIYIDEGSRKNQPYTVYENRAYGQERDGRAEYRYTAGDYYFNL